MHEVLDRNLYFVKEHVGLFKAASNYDILDPETQEVLLECREENLGAFTKLLRFTDYKRMTPFDTTIRTPDGTQVLRVKRGWTLLRSKVSVLDENNERIGGFKQKLFSIGGAFEVLDKEDNPVCTLKGKWTSWEFSFKAGDKELATVSKKWAGQEPVGIPGSRALQDACEQIKEQGGLAYPKRYADDERRRNATQPLAAQRVEAAANRLLRHFSLTCHRGHAGVVVPCIQLTGALNARRSGIPTGS